MASHLQPLQQKSGKPRFTASQSDWQILCPPIFHGRNEKALGIVSNVRTIFQKKNAAIFLFQNAWRCIIVDDLIPLLPNGLTGLPLTANNELWPLILTKALLKVSLACSDSHCFSPTVCLTGWIQEWENLKYEIFST